MMFMKSQWCLAYCWTVLSITFNFAMTLRLLCLFSLISLSQANTQDQCWSDADCSGPNQKCVIPTGYTPPCRQGICACTDCYTDDGNGGCTTPIQVKRPCACSTDQTCQDSCSFSDNFYPPNVECSDGIASCDDCSTFNNQTGMCDRLAEPGTQNANCTFDCDCQTDQNLFCLEAGQICMCAEGYRLTDSNSGQECVRSLYGDPCTEDTDCSDTYQSAYGAGSSCVNGTCQCGPASMAFDGYSDAAVATLVTTTGIVDDTTGLVTNQQICVIIDVTVNLTKGSPCTVDPIGNSQQSNIQVCGADLGCISNDLCPDTSTDTGYDGTCRKVLKPSKFVVTAEACKGVSLIAEANGTRLVGDSCKVDSDCGTNEFCSLPLMDPPCSGTCRCRNCYIDDYLTFCRPAMFLNIGDNCTGSSLEILLDKTVCDDDSLTVISDPDYRQSQLQQGQSCQSSLQCYGNLLCQSPTSQVSHACSCSQDFRWNSALSRCVPTKLGDSCSYSAACFGEMICQFNDVQGTCQYAANHCFHCPEDAENATCRAASEADDSTATVSGSQLDQCIPNWVNQVSGLESGCPFSKVGLICAKDSDCGTNEICNNGSRYGLDPPCQLGYCVCKDGTAQNSKGVCDAFVTLNYGDSCAWNIANLVYPTNLSCDFDGTVRCNACYNYANGSCTWSPIGFKPGDNCSSSCDCANDLMCSGGICACFLGSPIFDQTSQTCRRTQIGDDCSGEDDCASVDNANCDPNIGKCVCSTGFKNVTMTLTLEFTKFEKCVPSTSQMVGKNQPCHLQTLQVFGPASYCNAELACAQCPEGFGLEVGQSATSIDYRSTNGVFPPTCRSFVPEVSIDS